MASLSVFFTGVILQQFLVGSIFNLINMYIILPWMLYLGNKAWVRKDLKRGIGAVVLGIIFAFFHTTGIYLLVIVPIYVLIYILGKWLIKREWSEKELMLIQMFILSVSLIIVSLPVVHISPFPVRQLVDAIPLAFLTIIGYIATYVDIKLSLILGVLMTAWICITVLPMWFSYTSALKPADKEAIAYVNTLDGSGFYGNENMAYWIYDGYLKQQYASGNSIYIWRSEPMSPRTMESNSDYWNPVGEYDVSSPPNAEVLGWFCDGKVTVRVYRGQ
jgi:hypothetical protein